ncbi:MAG: GYD domain-containing protein [Chloroflexi bacterium]|nr:GYD domain-containing protein [Chloroflexota bacterium]
MAKFLLEGKYSVEGAKGLLKDGGSGRRAAIEKLVQSGGGKVESIYYAFGETDVFIILDMPDSISMAAVALTVGAAGGAGTKTTLLMTTEEVDEAVKKHPSYRPPGQ